MGPTTVRTSVLENHLGFARMSRFVLIAFGILVVVSIVLARPDCHSDQECASHCDHAEDAYCSPVDKECHCHEEHDHEEDVACTMDSECVAACNDDDAYCHDDDHCHCHEDHDHEEDIACKEDSECVA